MMEGRERVRAFRHKQPPEKHTDICRRDYQGDGQGCQVTEEKQKKNQEFFGLGFFREGLSWGIWVGVWGAQIHNS